MTCAVVRASQCVVKEPPQPSCSEVIASNTLLPIREVRYDKRAMGFMAACEPEQVIVSSID